MRIEHKHGQVVAGHLGGYVPGGDPNTRYPLLWTRLIDELKVRTVLDVGCGDPEGAARWFSEHVEGGCIGIDGLVENSIGDNLILAKVDYTTHSWRSELPIDLVWSAEFVEHVEARFMPNFLGTFMCGRWLAMTHAEPGQGGHHHVNCQTGDYWIGALTACGFQYEKKLTELARKWALAEQDIPPEANYFGRTGLVFRKISGLDE